MADAISQFRSWFCILIIEIVYDTSPGVVSVGSGIWILFIFYFALAACDCAKRMAFLKETGFFILAIVVLGRCDFFPFAAFPSLVRALTALSGHQVIWICFRRPGHAPFFERPGRRGAG